MTLAASTNIYTQGISRNFPEQKWCGEIEEAVIQLENPNSTTIPIP